MSKNNTGVKVKCITTGAEFKSIKEAAEYAGENNWTMGIKMSAFGYFEDSQGRKYIREVPMVTKNVYTGGKSPKVEKHMPKTTRKKKIKPSDFDLMKIPDLKPFDKFDNMPRQVMSEKHDKCPQIVKQAVGEKIKQMMKDAHIWDDVVQALDFLGVDKFEIKK